ncbi:hypothetical protein AB1L07_02255 [Niallia alba]|uniref:hypothetical protein n=1 Tax=Niallia alba TaxID=2729105 RepID=UPI002E1A0B74|nr:hypothetical protein [Niallia alba]
MKKLIIKLTIVASLVSGIAVYGANSNVVKHADAEVTMGTSANVDPGSGSRPGG